MVRVRARGRVAKYRCYRRFTLYGSKIIICSSGKWNKEPPICIRAYIMIDCISPYDTDHFINEGEGCGVPNFGKKYLTKKNF